MSTHRPLVAALTLAGLLISGCGAHFSLGSSTTELARSKLEAGLKDGIHNKTGVTISSSTCEGALRGEKGATQRCTVVDGDGKTIGVTVTTTDVQGSQIYFNWKVEDQPASSPA
ncbi:DUF4333 domain-containing protein [Mycobacterium sp. CBMA271]|uniref:DUF4333 domain-containing protein n=1 Tax=unclassified Mycobacteroides TaxID=2618759 RepID=UPI0012DC3FBE|nr:MULTISPECIES: DUF4333 domain-containing protein [unclassified Mycobacteroides]MUM18142.1 hypothetical protein [Mycobacteroides sp. CBMA 326]MUM20728.1 DUF4333 domain-containing protein [Mycobacteroides sp. CBMA 271]